MTTDRTIAVRALRSKQGDVWIYSFFLPGAQVLEIADICRLSKDKTGLEGFQRHAIQKHINAMVDYLNAEGSLFPNAILLALSPRVTFVRSRGPTPEGLIEAGEAGVLRLPPARDGRKHAWIVDGQQRSTALSRAADPMRPVPVIAFVSGDIQVHREQFILVNRARPLPKRLVDELLPAVDVTHLPPDMAIRQLPSALVDRLDADTRSPFFGLVRRTTSGNEERRVVTDSALLGSIQRQINHPMGALAPYRSLDGRNSDPSVMLQVLVDYWSAVREVFDEAWGLPPERSRLMHSAGIAAMGALLGYLKPRVAPQSDEREFYVSTLRRIAPMCAWTEGSWADLGRPWNEVQSTSRDIRSLTDQLIRLVHSPHLQRVA